MTLTPEERSRLAKLLAMTTSSHGPEAATAMGRANAMLRDKGLTWQDVLLPPKPPPAEDRPAPKPSWDIRSDMTRAQQQWDSAVRDLNEALARADRARTAEQARNRAQDRAERDRFSDQRRQPPHGSKR